MITCAIVGATGLVGSTFLKVLEEKNLKIDFSSYPSLQAKLCDVKKFLSTHGINSRNIRDTIVSSIVNNSEEISQKVCEYKEKNYQSKDRKIDNILTSKTFGIPIMLAFLAGIFWLTITGANYPSNLLSSLFSWIQGKLTLFMQSINSPSWLTGILIDGMYQTLSWVVAVMLPPMAIFFPLFTIMEDLGYLPRIAFNLDHFFKKACASGKQALTMCMGVTKW